MYMISKRAGIISGLVALALTGAGVAGAAIASSGPVDSSGVVHGCYSNAEVNGSHAFVLQDAGTTCPKGTTAISFNQTGPAGSAGPSGPPGPTGAAGSPGPSGPPGTVSSLDSLNGIPCDSGAGTTQVSYGSGGTITLTCATASPSPPPSSSPPLTASPDDNGFVDAISLSAGALGCGQSASYQLVSVGSSYAWFEVTGNGAADGCSLSLSLSYSGVPSPAGSGEVMDIYANASSEIDAGVTSESLPSDATYWIKVVEGTSATDGYVDLVAGD